MVIFMINKTFFLSIFLCSVLTIIFGTHSNKIKDISQNNSNRNKYPRVREKSNFKNNENEKERLPVSPIFLLAIKKLKEESKKKAEIRVKFKRLSFEKRNPALFEMD